MTGRDICILGAGPAGVMTALKLKQLGFDPVLMDHKTNQGHSLAQSLSPGVFTLLETVGVSQKEFLEICNPISRTVMKWERQIAQTFTPNSFLTDRALFDKFLLSKAVEKGIKVLPSTKVMSLKQNAMGWKILELRDGIYSTRKTSFLFDASGKKSIIRGPKKRVAPTTLCITGCWENTELGKNETRLESGTDHWIWGAVLPDGIFHVSLFLDPKLLKVSGNRDLVDIYISCLGKSSLFNCTSIGRLIGKPWACDSTPYYYQNQAGTNFIKVGTASIGLDPASSQGVQSALLGGIQAAIVLNTIYTIPKHRSLALEFYKERQRELIKLHLEKTSATYATVLQTKHHEFWQRRVSPSPNAKPEAAPETWDFNEIIRFSPDTQLKASSCIIGDEILTRPALIHPSLERPMVFWQSIEIGFIIETITGQYSVLDWITQWSQRINHGAAVMLFAKLKRVGILVSVGD